MMVDLYVYVIYGGGFGESSGYIERGRCYGGLGSRYVIYD